MTTREKYIAEHAPLFWYTPESKKKDISDSLLVETILNYGTMDDVKALFNLMGMDKVAEIFFAAKGRQKLNYFPQIYNFSPWYSTVMFQMRIQTVFDWNFDCNCVKLYQNDLLFVFFS